jgi:glycosyltransferase involved in cell wall biosynthesis
VAVVHNHRVHYQDLLFGALAERGVDLLVLYTAATSLNRPQLPIASSYRYFVAHHGPYESVETRRAAAQVWRILGRVRPRRLIISGWCDAAAWSAWCWGRAHAVPMILWSESNRFDRDRRPWAEVIKRLYVRSFRAAHVYGRSNRDYLLDLGVPPHRIFTGRAVVDIALFRRLPRPQCVTPHKTLVYVGRFAPEKDLPLLLTALSRLPQEPARPRLVLKLVGYGPQDSHLRSLAAQLGIEPFVEFHGPAAPADLPAIYSAADGLVLPSRSEPWGLVVNEAMCCALPAIVSDRCGCAADLVTPRTGWIFSAGDAGQLAAALERFENSSREKLVAMGAAARALASQFSPERGAAAVLECLDSVQ